MQLVFTKTMLISKAVSRSVRVWLRVRREGEVAGVDNWGLNNAFIGLHPWNSAGQGPCHCQSDKTILDICLWLLRWIRSLCQRWDGCPVITIITLKHSLRERLFGPSYSLILQMEPQLQLLFRYLLKYRTKTDQRMPHPTPFTASTTT